MKKRPPNIFVFMSDQEQAQVVKKGHPCITPYAEKLAEEGVLFNRCYTPAAHSCPARACYFTGLYPSHHGIYNNILTHTSIAGGINPGCRMFSENLREMGWNLGLTGKWHCSRTENPEDRGWDEVLPTATARDLVTRESFWNDAMKAAMKAVPDNSPRRRGEIVMPSYGRRNFYGTSDKKFEEFHDYQVVTKAIEAMEKYAREDKPFFIHCGPVSPHDTYVIPERYAKLYDPKTVPLPPNYHDTLEDKPRLYQRQRMQAWCQLSDDEVRESIAHYWGFCTMVDDFRKMIYDAVDSLGIRDNTILIFTSDHGDYLGAHGLYTKGMPSFDEAYRVPLIVRWPEGIENPGREVDEFVTLCDFAPTFLEVAGSEQNPTSGASFAPFFKSNTVENWTQEFHTQMNGVELYYTQRFVQTKEWKYVFNGFDFDELYDLRNDPYEMKNLAMDPAYDEIKHDLVKRMWKFQCREKDITGNKYFPVALMPWGPQEALQELLTD